MNHPELTDEQILELASREPGPGEELHPFHAVAHAIEESEAFLDRAGEEMGGEFDGTAAQYAVYERVLNSMILDAVRHGAGGLYEPV